MTDSANQLKRVLQFPEPKIPDNRNYDEGPHDQGAMPSLRDIGFIVEYDKTLNHIGKVSGIGCRICCPGEDSYPSYNLLLFTGSFDTESLEIYTLK